MEFFRLGYDFFDKIVAFDQANFPQDAWKKEDWEELLKDSDCHYFAHLVNEQIAANVFIYKHPEGYIKIMNLAVAKELRGQGMAVKLLDFVTEKYKHEGYARFYAETRASNLAMQRAFAESGYQFRSLAQNMYDNPQEHGLKVQLLLKA